MNIQDQIKLEGAPNFRDIGGYSTSDGHIFKKGLLFRSGDLSRITEKDCEQLSKTGIKTIIDLRTPNERKANPDRLFTSSPINFIHIPIYPSEKDPRKWKRILTLFNKKFDHEAFTRLFYHRIVFNHQSQIAQIINTISNQANLPALIHCVGGKDRTGVTSAFIQLLAGVEKVDIIQDYLLTNKMLEHDLAELLKRYRWLKIFNMSIEHMMPLLEARHYYLEEVLDCLIEKYRTIENYFTTACCIQNATLETLKQIILIKV